MIDMTLPKGGHKRLWIVELTEQSTGETVALPPLDDWHQAVSMVNHLAGIYGRPNVNLYQWDIANVWEEASIAR